MRVTNIKRPAAPWALRTVGKNVQAVHKKLCACCKKPFHKIKRPRAVTISKQGQSGMEERSICLPCVRELEQGGRGAGAAEEVTDGDKCGSFLGFPPCEQGRPEKKLVSVTKIGS
jgi:hypothetical protein